MTSAFLSAIPTAINIPPQPCPTCSKLRAEILSLKGAIAQARAAADHWRKSAYWASKARHCEEGEGRV